MQSFAEQKALPIFGRACRSIAGAGFRYLPPLVVEGILAVVNKLARLHQRVPVRLQLLDNRGQRLRRVQRRVVEQHDRPRLHPLEYPRGYLARGQVFPVKTITTGKGCKTRRGAGYGYFIVLDSLSNSRSFSR